MMKKQISLGRSVLCVLLCVIFTALTTYQFCYYAVYTDYRTQLSEQTGEMKKEYELLLSAREARIAELESSLQASETDRAALAAKVQELTDRLVSITGKVDGTAEDCLRMLMRYALVQKSTASGISQNAFVNQEVEAYMAQYADSYVEIAERLLLIDFLYRTNYNGQMPDGSVIEEGLIEGYIAAAGDVYAIYYTPQEYLDFAAEMNASIRCGIGVVSREYPAGGAIQVLYVHSSSPAKEAGVLAGDLIVAIDGRRVSEIGYDAAVSLVAGEANTEILLTVERNGEEQTLVAVRRKVSTDTVIVRTYEENGKTVGYIHLLTFSAALAGQLQEAYAAMAEGGVDALIFDVRDNTGGYLSSIVDVLDMILPAGKLLVSFEYGNENNSRKPYYSKTEQTIDLPIVVLQNRNTASAAELFAGALRDHGYATLIGETTRGKCTMQSGYKLENGSYIKVTVADYLPPSGESYQEVGLTPDKHEPLAPAYEGEPVYLLPQEQDAPLRAALELLCGVE